MRRIEIVFVMLCAVMMAKAPFIEQLNIELIKQMEGTE